MASAKTLATVLHLHRGTPYVYQGDELGMANSPFTVISDYRDIEALRFYAEATERGDDLAALLLAMAKMSRDQARTPVQWDASPGAGFTAGTPWLAINPDHVTVNAAAQVDDPDSVFAHYQRLIALRHEDPVVTDGDFELLLPEHPAIWAFLRRTPEAELLVAANFSAEPVGRAAAAGPRLVSRRRHPDQPVRRPPAASARPGAPPLGVRRLAPRSRPDRAASAGPVAGPRRRDRPASQGSWLISAYRVARARLTADSMLSSWFCIRRSCGSMSACIRRSCGPMSSAIADRR